MGFIYVLIALFVFIALLMLIPIKIIFNYSDSSGFIINFYIWFYKFSKKKKKKNEKTRLGKSKKNKSKKSEKSVTDKNNNKGMYKELFEIRSVIISTVSKLKPITDIEKVHIYVGADNAALCAINYGVISQGVAYAIEFIDCNTKMKPIKNNAVLIKADFTSHNIKADILVILKLRVYNLIKALFDFILNYFRHKNNK